MGHICSIHSIFYSEKYKHAYLTIPEAPELNWIITYIYG